jgi:GT2 family glycosyltransferase
VVRRDAFLEVGGFHPRFGIGGEEEVLALDLAASGHHLSYVPEIVAHHHPSRNRDARGRRRRQVRNSLWSAWLRRPVPAAVGITARTLRAAAGDAETREGALDAVRGLRWVLRERRVVPPHVDRIARLLG